MVITAPMPIVFHAVDISPNLPAIIAVSGSIAIDPCMIGLKPTMTFVAWIAERGAAHCQRESDGQSTAHG
ncbi:MAG: hypothetical protein ACLQMT_11385 [Candidatus Acidiferrales bacterium]